MLALPSPDHQKRERRRLIAEKALDVLVGLTTAGVIALVTYIV